MAENKWRCPYLNNDEFSAVNNSSIYGRKLPDYKLNAIEMNVFWYGIGSI